MNYESNVTSTLELADISIFINGTDVTSEFVNQETSADQTVPMKKLSGPTISTTSGKEEVVYQFTLYNFGEASRQSGNDYKRWSGNVSLKIAGRGEDSSTYTEDVLTDEYGNQNMMETDEGQTTDTWIDVRVEDGTVVQNSSGVMFADFIKPEFTYAYSTSDINHGAEATDEYVTVVFDVVDQYFASTTLSSLDASQITVKIADYNTTTVNNAISKTLEKVQNLTGTVNGVADTKIGERYKLTIKELDQEDATTGLGDGFLYSGQMSLVFDSGVITDKSGNTSAGTTIAIGLNENDGNANPDSTHGTGKIVDVVDPIWELGDITIETDRVEIELSAKDKYFNACTIDTSKILVYVNGELDGDIDGDGVLEAGETPSINKDITSIAPSDIKETVDGVAETLVGKKYTLVLSNITNEGYVTFEPTNLSSLDASTTDGSYEYKYKSENGGNISIKIDAGTITDKPVDGGYNSSNEQEFDIANVDAVQPEVYVVRKTQDATANTETIVFNVTDRNYDSSNLVEKSELTLKMDDTTVNALRDNATFTSKEIWGKPTGVSEAVILGHQYTLVVSNISETTKQTGKDFMEWSGTLELEIAEDAANDMKGNTLNTDTTIITDFIDYIEPEIQQVTVANPKDTTNKTYTMSFNVIDKYLDKTNKVEEDEITVYIDGVEATAIAKPTTAADQETHKDKIWIEVSEPTDMATVAMKKTVDEDVDGDGVLDTGEDLNDNNKLDTFEDADGDGILDTGEDINENGKLDYGTVEDGNYSIGQTYTVVLSNFEQSTKQTGKDFMEWSGTVKLVIDQDAVNDENGENGTANNILDIDESKRTLTGELVDYIIPVVEKVSSTPGTNTETIVFNVIDKYLDTTNLVTTSEIEVYIDGEKATAIAKPTTTADQITHKDKIWMELSRVTANDVTASVNGTSRTVLHQYQLILSNFEQSSRNSSEYKDWSGTVSIKVLAGAVTDTSNNQNIDTELKADFVDFIKPDLKYIHNSADVSGGTKTYTMTFTVTDKYYESGVFTVDDITNGEIEILMQNGQYEAELDENGNPKVDADGVIIPKTDANGNKIPIVYNLKDENVTIRLESTPYNATNVSMTNSETGEIETVASTQIGHTYTLTISNLEQLEIKSGFTTLDYSGVVTVSLPGDRIIDTTGNKNVAKTITSGVNIPGGTTPDDIVEVDAVAPLIEKISASAYATVSTDPETVTINGTITIRATDTYFASSTLTSDLKVRVNDSDVTASSSINVDSETQLKEYRKVDETTSTITQYGAEYTITITTTITGNYNDAKQLKVRIPAGTVKDESGNGNEATDLILYNCLGLATGEGDATDGFLDGNGTNTTGIARQDIEHLIFVNSLDDVIEGAIPKIWDRTANTWTIKDGIANVWDVSALGDQSILAWTTDSTAPYTVYVGSNDEIFANINSTYLFANIGSSTNCDDTTVIEGLDLLNTKSVTTMSGMFKDFGSNAMTEFVIGENFNTANVTNMNEMFYRCGFNAMEKITFGDNFDTSKVTIMNRMFYEIGNNKLASLDLSPSESATASQKATKFNTGNVESMEAMFYYAGRELMTSFDIGDNFDTSNVTNMRKAFYAIGYQSLTSLDLGDKFNTIKVEDMTMMFRGAGYFSLTSFDIGENFNTSNVKHMSEMFYTFAKNIEHLDLGELFYTTNVTDMVRMFYNCGQTNMTVLDLGPVFTRIPDGNYTYESVEDLAYSGFVERCGKSTTVIYAPEAIYSNEKAFKLNTDSTTTIEYTLGKINCFYAPEWIIETETKDVKAQTASFTIRGIAEKTAEITESYKIEYLSDITSSLSTGLKILADGTDITSQAGLEIVEESIGAREVKYTVNISEYTLDADHLEVQIPRKTLDDVYGNTNLPKSLIIYTSLRLTSGEGSATSSFLGNTNIARQDIEKVVFYNNLDNAPKDADGNIVIDNVNCWDVSARQEDSILAWYSGTAPYTVYIGSNNIMLANRNSSRLFAYIGRGESCDEETVIEGLGYLNTFNTTSMHQMFRECGYNAMKKLDLGNNFLTEKVTTMESMFLNCGFNAMTELILGDNFDTTNVESMDSTFYGVGHESKEFKQLDLGDKFYTSKVTTMQGMFRGCGTTALESLDLGDNFDTTNVENMNSMFRVFAYNIKQLDLGDKFKTSNVTDMYEMFRGAGQTSMAVLDLGPLFTQIPDGTLTASDETEYGAHDNFITTATGMSGCIIYAPESIYSSETAFKLNSTDTTTTISWTRGTINPIYRPEWIKASAELKDTDTDPKLEITLKATANRVETYTNPTYKINYVSNVTPSATIATTFQNMKIYIDGEDVTSIVRPEKDFVIGTTTTNATSGKTELTGYKVTLSNLEELVRQTDPAKPFKEWSGNISLVIDGRGQDTSTYTKNVLVDEYGNQSMTQIQEGGTWIDVEVKDGEVVENTTDTMFIDYIKPEFTYKYAGTSRDATPSSNPEIDYENKKVTVVFEVTDKYYESTSLTSSDITVKMSDFTDEVVNSNITKTLTKTHYIIMAEDGTITYSEVPADNSEYELQTGESKIGEKFEFVVEGLEQQYDDEYGYVDENGDIKKFSDGFEFSGYMSIVFPSGKVVDKSENENPATTIAIGLDEDDGNPGTNTDSEDFDQGEQVIVDVVDPVWVLSEASVDTGIIKIRAKEKYLQECTISKEKITVYVNNAQSTAIVKDVTGPVEVAGTDGTEYEYTVQLSNLIPGEGGYYEFTPTETIVGGTAKYKADNSGSISIEIEAGTIVDTSGNESKLRRLDIGNMDATKPEIFDVQKTVNETDGIATFIFNVTDRNYDPTDFVEEDEITLWVDGIDETDNIEVQSLTSVEIKTVLPGTTDETVKVVGHQYTLVLKEIVETQTEFVDSGREYRDLSGTLEVRIAEDAAQDFNANTLDTSTTTLSQFVDFIRPEVNYIYAGTSRDNPVPTNPDINYDDDGDNIDERSFTMVFEILDKYIKESTLKTQLDSASTDAEKQTVIENFLEILIDGESPDWSKVDKDLTVEEVEATIAFNKTVDGAIVNDTHVIGYKYTLTLSNLEQLQIKSGDKYRDYSGVITVAIDASIATDQGVDGTGTTPVGNVATTITSGLDIVGDVQEEQDATNHPVNVDLVDPLWEKVSSSANAIDPNNTDSSTATITFKGTDKYFKESKITQDNIKTYVKVYAHTGDTPGTAVTDVTNSVDIEINSTTDITDTFDKTIDEDADGDGVLDTGEDLNSNGKLDYGILYNDEYLVGKQYTIIITGFSQNVNQVKIAIQPNTMIDTSGNGNKVTEMLLYNTLRLTNEETDADEDVAKTKPFLGSNTTIQRQNIENVTFLSNTTTVPATGWWDASAAGDNSIKAWAEQTGTQSTRGVYTIYIASDDEIFANQNSSYLFTNIGHSTNCTATETITSLNLLNTSSVTDMNHMFYKTGYIAMTSLTLPESFDTCNVTDMSYMFNRTGYTAMTSFELGNNFDTMKVKNMSYMFGRLGYTKMQSLDLSSDTDTTNTNQFNTSSVTSMRGMFNGCGYTEMTTLNLGNNFNTTNVEKMDEMFAFCGYTKLTSLDLSAGRKDIDGNEDSLFNTANVKDMNRMFYQCGYEKMTSLNLGNNFNTINVGTSLSGSMEYMFYECGYKSMTSLDLKDEFDTSNVTNMSNMFNACGQYSMTTLILGDKFDTSKVTDMNRMFRYCGTESLTSLDLGDKFYTTNATDMEKMFTDCGIMAMKTLDLGPAFTKIANSNTDFVTIAGASGCVIYAPESIYSDMKHFKINTNSSSTIEYTQGTINPIYKPEWEKVSSTLNIATNADGSTNLEGSTISVTIKGHANKTFTNGTYTGTYLSEITSLITAGNDESNQFLVKIDGELDGDTDGDGILETGETPSITKTVEVVSTTTTEVQYKITLSGFGESVRQSGKNFTEWSGNIAIQPVKGTLVDKYGSYLTTQTQTDAEGNSVEVQVPVTGVFTDASGNYIGNKNMIAIDNADGNWLDIEIRDAEQTAATGNWIDDSSTTDIQELEDNNTDANTNGIMFTDYIRPEFTYEYYNSTTDTNANTVISYTNNKITVVFDVTDKYFASTTLATDTTGTNITVKVDEDADANTAITKALGKKTLAEDQVVGDITYKANGDIYYTVNGVSKKIGERYELVITGLESSNGVGYSGPMTLTFPAGIITDQSGNTSLAKTITIGIDEPNSSVDSSKHPDHNTEVIVDVVNPIWSYADSNIDRTNKQVNIYLIGSDKYYKENTLDIGDITVYVDGSSTTVDTDRDGTADANVSIITKTLKDITSDINEDGTNDANDTTRLNELIAGAGLTSSMTADNNLTKVGVVYKLTLSTFGAISGETSFVIAADTIEDTSGNKNLVTDKISVGNVTWTETDDDSTDPRYPAFRNDIVDFIKPTINYTYSTVVGSENPDIDYEQKTVTVKFTVTDKYLLESDLIKTTTDADGNTIQIPNNINIIVDGTTVYDSSLATQTTEVTTTISETAIANGKEYTLIVSNIQQTNEDQPTNTTPENGDGFNFSGPMQLVFAEGVIDDTSGNKNVQTTITLDTEIGSDIVDVVDPIIYYSSSTIDRTNNQVTLTLKAEDKYLSTQTLITSQDSVKIKVVDEYGNTIVNDNTTIDKEIVTVTTQPQYVIFRMTISNFGVYEGKTSVIIPEDVIKDTSGNGNVETEILVGSSSDATAFKDSIVDFTKPTWEYSTSTIDRVWDTETGEYEDGARRLENGESGSVYPDIADGKVTITVKGTDIYFDKDTYYTNAANQLDLTQVKVYINGVENTSVTKTLKSKEYIEETKTLATGYDRVFKGVAYTIELGNFGTNEDDVRIDIPADAIKDTSLNGNILTPINVGNECWLEIDVDVKDDANDSTPAIDEDKSLGDRQYDAFRNDIVDFIKPKIKYQYEENVNPKLDRTNETVDIKFTVTDHNFLGSDIELEDIDIYIDNWHVYGTGANVNTDITASLSTPVAIANGLEYTLTLSALELNGYIEDVDNDGVLDEGEDFNGNGQLDTLSEMFERHSGVIRLVFANDPVYDTSGNRSEETTIIVDNGDGDSEANGVIVDFINPNIYYQDQYINWEDRYALITVRATDRFYDNTTGLQVSDLKLYQLNEDTGEYIEITDIPDDDITITSVANSYGQDFIIRIDNFDEEFKMKISIAGGTTDTDGTILTGIGDTSGNVNDATDIYVDLDNKRPSWKYVSTVTTNFESSGTISFNVKGVDKFLDLDVDGEGNPISDLENTDITVLRDGVDITNVDNITVTNTATDEDEKSKSYKIDVTGLTETGTYTLVLADGTLIDIYGNASAATTISFSNSAISSNTGNYVKVTYHVTPDMETLHSSYVHELISVNETGTNYNTTEQMANATYLPSSIGELNNNGENPLFAEPIYEPAITGYTVSSLYKPKSFAGWAVCDEDGTVADGATVYGLYDEIPITVTNLKAVWQEATVVFVSNTAGSNSNTGQFGAPVKDLATAYSKLNSSGNSTNNIIVIMDAIEWTGSTTLTGDATITSLYAGVDYAEQGAELKISSNMTVDGDVIFDNIKLYASSTTVSDGTDYLGNGTYTNMLISNYSGDITLGRGITTPSANYTFGAIVGGNFATETSTGTLGTHTIRVEAGKYNNIIAGSTLSSSTITNKSITHEVIIGNMRDTTVSKNDKLTITGYVAIGENEQNCYPNGATTSNTAADKDYANVTLYSGTITAVNKFTKSTENSAIYLRSINGKTDGMMNFKMYGGDVTGNIYGGARIASVYETTNYNTMNFYGGELTGHIFGQGANETFTGTTTITLQGIFNMTGNIYGGSNVTTTATASVGSGNTNITIDSSSITINGNIYGGGNMTAVGTGFITGNTNITFKSGTVSNIYGGGYNLGNTGTSTILIENGTVSGNIFGGAYQNQVRTTSNITVLGGTVSGNIFGGNDNADSQLDGDTYYQNVNIIIGDTDATKEPTINGTIYGGGKYDKVGTATIELIECSNATTVYGGSNTNATTLTANIYLKGMTVDNIYGGGQSAGVVAVSNIYLQSGTVTDVYGGGFATDVTESHITLEGTATATSIYGGSNTSGTVTTSNVTLTSGTVTNVFGGGNSAGVTTSNVTLNGTISGLVTIYGGSKDAGVTTTSNVTLTSGTVTNVFGGGLDVGVITANIKQQGASVTNIYGGNNSGSGSGGDTGTTNIEIIDSTVVNVYGGNKDKGTTRYTNINIHGTSTTVTGNIYGGGYCSSIGKGSIVKDANGNVTEKTVTEAGSTTINIAGGTINGDINGGSEQSVVYGNTNINIGQDATVSVNSTLTPGNINIKGIIYGAGSTLIADEITVLGKTVITMDNSTNSPIQYFTATGAEKPIYGSGNGGAIYSSETTTDNSSIHLKDFGTAETPYLIKSIEDTGDLYIGSSVIELSGNRDDASEHYYTLNTIINDMTIYSNTTLYTQRGFNKVGGFYSYVNKTSTKATVTITDGVAETNTNGANKLYTLEGINLIFAKKEVNLSNKSTLTLDDWGEVTGMAYFGVYKNTSTGKQYDLDLFRAGTYVEGQYNQYHDEDIDGFYTTVDVSGTETAQIITTTNYTYYCDWIVNAPTINYDVDLIASAHGDKSVAELLLNYNYASDYTYKGETIYTLNQVSTNALKPDIELVDPTDPTKLPTISTNANKKFGLTMETTESGWKKQASTTILSSSNGSHTGDTVYTSDAQTVPGTIKFKVYNSLNITEEKDLGNVNIILTGQQPLSGGATEAYTFNVVIAVSLQTIVDQLDMQYIPSFTDKTETELSYTVDSRVDLSYLLYNNVETSPYTTDADGDITDYRVLSTTIQLPANTKLTLKDYGQGDSANKVYYYQIPTDTSYDATTTVDGITRYLYKLSKFTEIGSTDSKYSDSTSYYNETDKYVLEKYDLSIDFINSGINTNKLAQETYLELRDSSGNIKYDNGETIIKYNLYTGQNAVITFAESNSDAGTSYSVVDTIEIPMTISASILEQSGVLDTKYRDQIVGIAIQIVDTQDVRTQIPELQNYKLTNTETGEEYTSDINGVIRVPVIEGLGSMTGKYELSITQINVPSGTYKVQVRLITADDGKYYGNVPEAQKTFNITFINSVSGSLGVQANYDTRIINESTGLNLAENTDTTKAIDMTLTIQNPTNDTNIRVELYKRNPTYTSLTDETTYTGTSYTLVDISQYLQGTWTTPEDNSLVSATGSKEYMVLTKKTYESVVESETIEFERAIKDGISTGEYKLVFKAYSNDTLVQEVRKTFIVTP